MYTVIINLGPCIANLCLYNFEAAVALLSRLLLVLLSLGHKHGKCYFALPGLPGTGCKLLKQEPEKTL